MADAVWRLEVNRLLPVELTMNKYIAILVVLAAAGCENELDLKGTDGPTFVPPPIHGNADAGAAAAAPAPEVERSAQALWVNPPAGACTGDQPSNTVRVKPVSGGTCLQFGANIEIPNLGIYTWPDGSAILNDTVNWAVGDLHSHLGKCQRITLWWDINFTGQSWWQQRCYTGGPGGGWNVWLIAPDNLTWWQASSMRYETWNQ